MVKIEKSAFPTSIQQGGKNVYEMCFQIMSHGILPKRAVVGGKKKQKNTVKIGIYKALESSFFIIFCFSLLWLYLYRGFMSAEF